MAEDKEYKQIFDMLLTQAEDEVVEFKTAEDQFDRDKMGRYFSALSNEANLRLMTSLPPTPGTSAMLWCVPTTVLEPYR